jgi:hypothetical protein
VLGFLDMKKIFLLFMCPVFLFAGKLTEIEMEHLITTTMWSEKGWQPYYNGYLLKNLPKKKIWVVNPYWYKQPSFLNINLITIDEETKAFIKNLALQHKQLTGMDFELYFDEELSFEEYKIRTLDGNKMGKMDIVFMDDASMRRTAFLDPVTPGFIIYGLNRFSSGGGQAYVNVEVIPTKERIFKILLEETTQTLGLRGDTWDHNDSIFYAGINSVTQMSEMDRKIINAIYQPEVKLNMKEAELRAVVAEVGYDDEAVFGGVFAPDYNATEEPIVEPPPENNATEEPTPDKNETIEAIPETNSTEEPIAEIPSLEENSTGDPITENEENGSHSEENLVKEPIHPAEEPTEWLWWGAYPWVYRAKDNYWYYFRPHESEVWVWSQETGEWKTYEEWFGASP